MPLSRALALAFSVVIAAPVARANPAKSKSKSTAKTDPADKDAKAKGSGDDDDDDDDDDAKPAKPAAAGSASTGSAAGDDDDDDDDDDTPKAKARGTAAAATGATAGSAEAPLKQDLTGHDLGAKKKPQPYERDRFFVDKVDTEKTQDHTLVQGSLTLSTFFYGESGGAYGGLPTGTLVGNDTTAPSVYWGDLRLQTDFRHISGGIWDARVDFRTRFVNTPANDVNGPMGASYTTTDSTQPNRVQSGLLGENEYDLRELWLIRNGERTDVTIGRQYIMDLGAVKIDGVRVDYASSPKFTYLGFAGLYPLRGSRSLATDYEDAKDPNTGQDDGRFTGAGGFGGAYRTQQAYGSIGGVALVPFEHESARIFGTSSGYWRVNPVLDIYHFALIDVVSDYGAQLTNLSGGLNYKPTPRLRLTASYNRTDTDTLGIQAANFYTNATGTIAAPGYVLNEIYVSRIATNEARGSISAALGNNERFELTAALSYKERPSLTLDLTPPTTGTVGTNIALSAAQSVEVYGSITDRHSVEDARIGIDGLQTITLGTTAYDRSDIFVVRGFVSRELDSGKGEWEGELSYTEAKDTNGAGYECTNLMSVADCYGASKNSVISLGGTIYYRLDRNWFVLGSLYLQRTSVQTTDATAGDAPINGATAFARIAYRF